MFLYIFHIHCLWTWSNFYIILLFLFLSFLITSQFGYPTRSLLSYIWISVRFFWNFPIFNLKIKFYLSYSLLLFTQIDGYRFFNSWYCLRHFLGFTSILRLLLCDFDYYILFFWRTSLFQHVLRSDYHQFLFENYLCFNLLYFQYFTLKRTRIIDRNICVSIAFNVVIIILLF